MDVCDLQTGKKRDNKTPIIEQCPYLKRLVYASYFYEGNRNNASLSSFLNEVYPIIRFIDDIKHYKFFHCNDNELLAALQNQLLESKEFRFTRCALDKCEYSTRHFSRGDTREISLSKDKSEGPDALLDMYGLEMDNLHFNLWHLFDAGFRTLLSEITPVTGGGKEKPNSGTDDGDETDADYMEMVRVIMNKREKFNRFESNYANKYNINATLSNEATFRDLLFNEIQNENIIHFIIEQQFESDTIDQDLAEILFCGDDTQQYTESNFYALDKHQHGSFISMLRFMEKYKSYASIFTIYLTIFQSCNKQFQPRHFQRVFAFFIGNGLKIIK